MTAWRWRRADPRRWAA